MKKALALILVIALGLGTASFVMAGDETPSVQPPGQFKRLLKEPPQIKMNSEQKEQMTALIVQMLELKKQVIQQNAADNIITQDRAAAMLERIDTQLEAVKSGDFSRKGRFGFRGGWAGPRCFRQFPSPRAE